MIRIEGLKKTFGVKTVLDDVSLHFPEGERIALVGANGAGKTTLLDILTGEQDLDAGQLIKPSRLKLGYLPQEPNPEPQSSVLEEALAGGPGYIQDLVRRHRRVSEAMANDYTEETHRVWDAVDEEFRQQNGYAIDGMARSILSGLGFRETMLGQSPKSLSGGWRMRLELAKIFLNKPNFLILDEPTNHLDLPSLVWVENWLQSFDGTLLFVSHDQSLLRRLPTTTLHLNSGRLTGYKGNFDHFLEEREKRLNEEAAMADNLRRRREHLEKFVERFGAKATKASQAQSKLKMIARIRDLESGVTGEAALDSMHLSIPMGPASGRTVLSIEDGVIGYGQPLCEGLSILVERGQKIAVIGANGIGKSTLLKTIAQKINPLAGTFKLGHNVALSWFAQDQLDTLESDKSVLDNVLSSSSTVTNQIARSILGALLFSGDDVNKVVRVLSGGEKARVGLARLLANQANFLILDEPTNHLDISSCEILSQAIRDYEGTVMFVSHDREFIDGVCTHVFAMLPDGRARLFEGSLEDYRRQAKRSGFPDVLDPVTGSQLAAAASNKSAMHVTGGSSSDLSESDVASLRRDLQRLQKKIDQLDRDIEKNTLEIQVLDQQLAECGGDFQKAGEISTIKQDVESRLAASEQQWLENSETAEKLRTTLKENGRSV